MKHKAKAGKPLIGITLDREEGGQGRYSRLPWYALRENYCSAVSDLGAVALPLPHALENVADYLELIDGLIITGGAFDVSPALYGEKISSDKVSLKDRRTQFEFAITKGAIERKLPVLGICGGEQLLNVVLGGTLIQHIPDTVANALEHEQKNPRTEPGHEVTIVPGTLLHSIVSGDYPSPRRREVSALSHREGNVAKSPHPAASGSHPLPEGEGVRISVNTAHHQAVAKPAPGTVVNATTSDGVIEGIELTDHPFCLGVQWHPEYFVSEADNKIFEAFVAASGK